MYWLIFHEILFFWISPEIFHIDISGLSIDKMMRPELGSSEITEYKTKNNLLVQDNDENTR